MDRRYISPLNMHQYIESILSERQGPRVVKYIEQVDNSIDHFEETHLGQLNPIDSTTPQVIKHVNLEAECSDIDKESSTTKLYNLCP